MGLAGAAAARGEALRRQLVEWVVNRGVQVSNRKLDVAGLQARAGAYAQRPVELRVRDLGMVFVFQVGSGKVRLLPAGTKAPGGIVTTSDCLLSIARGKRKILDQRSGRTVEREYGPLDAITHGELAVWGEQATNDALTFARVLAQEVYPQLRGDLDPAAQDAPAPPSAAPVEAEGAD